MRPRRSQKAAGGAGPDHADVLARVARRIRSLRVARRLTQESLAAELDIATKNLQRIEGGRQNLTLLTLARIAIALRVDVGELLAPSKPGDDAATDSMLAHLAAFGYLVRSPLDSGRRRKADVPVVDLTAMGGRPRGAGRTPRVVGWVHLPEIDAARTSAFVARVQGNSMAPDLPHGGLALFKPARSGRLEGRVFLIGSSEAVDGQITGPYSVKRVGSVTGLRDGRTEVVLQSDNPTYSDRVVIVDEGGEELFRHELVRVLAR